MPGKRQRPFNRPEDVTRMLQRISRAATVDWDKIPPIERAALLSRIDPAPAAYEYEHHITALDLTAQYFTVQLFGTPANYNSSKDANESDYTAQVRRFWKSPIGAENVDRPLPAIGKEFGENDFMRGWAFHALDIFLEYFTPGAFPATIQRGIKRIRVSQFDRSDPNGLWDPLAAGGYNPARCGILATIFDSTNTFVQCFRAHGPGGPDAAGTEVTPGLIRDFPLLPNNKFIFEDFSGPFLVGDVVSISMSGEWRFYPYYIGAGDEPNR